jgi:DNA-binding MarR family transcriptional regulator
MRIQKFLEESPLFNLHITYDEILGDFQKRLAHENVHFLQALVLTGLFFEEKAMRPTELAKTFSASKSNLSHALRDLERKGLVERQSHSKDARAYFFNLTREGKKRVPKLIKLFDSTETKIESALPAKKINSSLKFFRQIYRDTHSDETL